MTPLRLWSRRAGAVAAAILLLGTTLSLAYGERYFPPWPDVDTRFAPGYSEAGFDALAAGMTRDEVVARLGPPLRRFPVRQTSYQSARPSTVEGWSYSGDGACSWGDFAWLGREVYFDNAGRLTETIKQVYPD